MLRLRMIQSLKMVIIVSAGSIGVQLSGSNPTPQNAGQLVVNHIDDYGILRKELGMSAALSVILLIIVWVFNRLFTRFFREKERRKK